MAARLNIGHLPTRWHSEPAAVSVDQSVPTQNFIWHYPRLSAGSHPAPGDVRACEKMLSEWFEAPVILLASGKSGLHLYLQAKGFHRYRHQLLVPPYLSRCFINAFTPTVFPVHIPAKADAVFLYHQYGFPQRIKPDSPTVIEDIAHLFFTSPSSGARRWIGEVAVFSLPKFFTMGGIVGGLVIHNQEIEAKIRARVNRAPNPPPGTRSWMRRVIAHAYEQHPTPVGIAFLSSAYELLLEFITTDPEDLAGFPASLTDIRRVGEERCERVAFFRDYLGDHACPSAFWPPEEKLLPFALPYFGRGDLTALQRANDALEAAGVRAGIYHLDVNRNMSNPHYEPCLLLPCHQEIPLTRFEEICRLVAHYDRA